MSEYDRGAYTPPTEESFAFDARPTETRRPVPATLIGTLVVLVVLVGAVGVFYWSGVRGAGEAPHVVGKPQLQIKTPPPVDAKPIDNDDGKLDVYDEEKGQAPSSAPAQAQFAPAPEQPQPRPTVQAEAQAAAAAPAAAPVAAKPAPAPVPAAARPAAAPESQSKPVAATHPNDAVSNLLARNEALAVAAAKAAPKAARPAKAEAAAPAEAAHGVTVQIGAFSSAAIADTEFAKTKAAFARFTAGKTKHVERAEVGGKVYWRTAFTGFDHAGAKAFCEALKAAKKGCIVR